MNTTALQRPLQVTQTQWTIPVRNKIGAIISEMLSVFQLDATLFPLITFYVG